MTDDRHGASCTCDACMDRDEHLFTVWHDVNYRQAQRVRELFLEKLAQRYPGHPWLKLQKRDTAPNCD